MPSVRPPQGADHALDAAAPFASQPCMNCHSRSYPVRLRQVAGFTSAWERTVVLLCPFCEKRLDDHAFLEPADPLVVGGWVSRVARSDLPTSVVGGVER